MDYTFLICSERSGSNLITRMVDSHSLYCGPSPVHLFRILLEHRDRYGDLRQDDNREILLRDTLALLRTKLGVWQTDWTLDDLRNVAPQGSLAQLLKEIYRREAVSLGKRKVFIKENHLYRFLPFILSEFPSARLVWMVRDPRDMALSWKRSPNLRGCVLRAAKIWQQDQSESWKVYCQLYDSGKIILLRYEDLVAQAEEQLRRLCRFLQIDYEAAMLEFDQADLTAANAGRSVNWANLSKPVISNNFNKYKSGLSGPEIAFIEAVCGEEMQRLGYRPENQSPGDAGELEKALLPFELQEKPGYRELSEQERQMHRRRYEVVQQIKRRPVCPGGGGNGKIGQQNNDSGMNNSVNKPSTAVME